MKKQLLFTLSKNNGDFIVQPFRGSGKGGQKKNKTMSACRIIHPASGTVSECQEERSFTQNKKKAFKRLLEKDEFKKWYKIECAKKIGSYIDVENEVNKMMNKDNLKIEILNSQKWIEDNNT